MPAPVTKLQPIRGTTSLNPGSIEMFATLCHVLYAHIYNPHPIGTEAHHKAATDYLREFQRKAALDRTAADAASATYAIGFQGRNPLIVRVLIGKPPYESLEMMTATGAYVPMDLTGFALIMGPRK